MTYWKDRQKKLYTSLEKDEEKLKKRLNKFYEKEAAKLDTEIAAFYSRYGENNIIKYRNLLEKLSPGDIKLLYEKWDKFAEKYPQYAYLMPVRENIYKLNRLEGLEYSVRMQQLEVGAITNEELTKHLSKQAQRGANAAAEVMGFGKNFYSIDSDIVKSVVGVAWADGKNFSERIWGNTDKLANYLKNDLAQGFARGDSYEKLGKSIRERFINVSRRDAYRLVYTEGTYVMAHSTLKPFEKDFQQYKIATAGDSKVCSVCRGVEHKVFDIKDKISGVNFPPFHSWCRCSFEIYVADWDKWMEDYVQTHGDKDKPLKIKNKLSDNNSQYEDVLTEYSKLKNKASASLEFDNGYEVSSHKSECEIARWLLENFGGEIKVLSESQKFKVKTADYEWNGKLWDLKDITTAKAADSAIRKGLKQIESHPGGIILNLMSDEINLEELLEFVGKRIRRSSKSNVDILIKKKDEVLKIIRYKK